jgi:hypothetical protein
MGAAIAIALISVTAMVCLVSFIPKVAIPWFKDSFTSRKEHNLFFGDIATFSPNGYVTALLIANEEKLGQ